MKFAFLTKFELIFFGFYHTFIKLTTVGWTCKGFDITNPFVNCKRHRCFLRFLFFLNKVLIYVYIDRVLSSTDIGEYLIVTVINDIFIWIGNPNPCLRLNRRPQALLFLNKDAPFSKRRFFVNPNPVYG